MHLPIFAFLRHELELQRAQLFLWLPVLFGVGIGLYFLLPSEPPLFLGVALFLLSFSLFVVSRKQDAFHMFLVILACVSAGFMMSSLRTHSVYTPILEKKLGPVDVIGNIAKIEKLEAETGTRVTFEDLEIEGLEPEKTPVRVRLRVREDDSLQLNSRVKVLAELQPPSIPVMPGGFDFRRYMYFHRIGAVGFVYRAPELITPAAGYFESIEALSASITAKIQHAMEGAQEGIAVALITGQQTGIAEEDLEAVRAAGLAHMLSISGLHIGLFSGIVFFIVRGFLALIPGFALRHPIKKYAAVLAFAAAFFYLMISGFLIPAQRSLIMAGIVFIAIIFDRLALSLRLIAFAALVVLLLAPESLLSASFQMSFGAVVCLIVFYDAIRDWWAAQYHNAGMFKRAALYFLGISFTTVIATIGTAPFSIFHFQQFSTYSLLANFVAIPILGFLIMPLAILALFVMPFGIEGWPLRLMAYPIQWILDVSYWVAELPYAILRIPMVSIGSLILCVVGALILFLWRGYGRWAGVFCIVASLILGAIHKRPDVLVSQSGDLWAFSDRVGGLYVSARNKDRFSIESWERLYGVEEGGAINWPREGALEVPAQDLSEGWPDIVCGEQACRLGYKGHKISFLKHPVEAPEECAWADLVVVADPLSSRSCDAVVIDKFDAHYDGAHAIWLGEKIRVQSSIDSVGRRLWSPADSQKN
jgi:competence protein ComEC